MPDEAVPDGKRTNLCLCRNFVLYMGGTVSKSTDFPSMPLIRSRLPFWFKLSSVPILLWMIVAMTYFRQDAPVDWWMLRSVIVPIAVVATGYTVLVLGVLRLVSLAK